MKRIVRRPWGRKRQGGWIIQTLELQKVLREGDVAEFNGLQVGAGQLRQLIANMAFPDQEILVRSNGNLEVSNIERYIVTKDGRRTTGFRKPKLEHSFRVINKAWMKDTFKTVVVIRPRKF